MNSNKNITIKSETDRLIFSEFMDYNIGNILYHVSDLEFTTKVFTLKGTIYRLFCNCFIQKYNYIFDTHSDSKILFNITHSHTRKDTFELVNSVASLLKTRDFIYPNQLKRTKVRLLKGMSLLSTSLNWYKRLKSTKLNSIQKLLVVATLIDVKRLETTLNKIEIEKYSLLVVPYDASSTQNFIVQYCKQKGIKTATLQHGVFVAPRDVPGNLDFTGIELKNFISDYYLVWNQFSIDEAIKFGINSSRLKLIGNPKYMKASKATNPKNKTFGIILNTKIYAEDNIILIGLANQLAEKLNYNYVMKYHPASPPDEFDTYANNHFYLKSDLQKKSVAKYADSVEFSLLSNSTVFIELIHLDHTVYKLNSESLSDKYRDLKYNSFKNLNELYDLYIKQDNAKKKELFNYLCAGDNTKNNYLNFLNQFI